MIYRLVNYLYNKIKSINYNKKFNSKVNKPCEHEHEHESDGKFHYSNASILRCKKCKFYYYDFRGY
jgi:hypothetical protein